MARSPQLRVGPDEWKQAQQWERAQWLRAQGLMRRHGKNVLWRLLRGVRLVPRYRGDDWNYWWKAQFDDYAFLPESVPNAIELGCGPYTNFRLIVERCAPKHLVLSDPLIWTYVRFPMTYVSELYRKGPCCLDDHAIEVCPFATDYFDLVVMINVLDHVQDATRCLQQALRITRPGGFLLVGQDLTSEEDVQRSPAAQQDIGHPIRIHHEDLDALLLDRVTPLIRRVLARARGRNPEAHYGTYILAGRKQRPEPDAASASVPS